MSELWVKKMKRYFYVLDKDRDGVVTRKDFEMIGDSYFDKAKLDPARKEKIQKSMSNVWRNFSRLAGTDHELMTESAFIESVKEQRNDTKFKATLSEAASAFVGAFDTNEDGFLQEDEYRRMFEAIDMHSVASYSKISFDAMDTNHDGKLSKDEMITAYLDFVLSEDEESPYRFLVGPLE